ncbi:MAG: U32 family peptidase, partial [Eggerthellaceae bacterium]|nr:U32 family peptidase [Eggerthellaceae bacterium]
MARPLVELLAPAGNETCLHAAVRAGADAVYLGVESFNARRGADNFTLESLADACAWAHLRGVRIFLTVNTVVLPSEVTSVLELVRQAWVAGVDAFIVQDIGVAAEVKRTLPEAEIHISTQMNTHSKWGIAAAGALGAKRVTLARELAMPEVRHLCDSAHSLGMHVEVFAHGALCICYSGQCFASSLIGGRSANRGMCAQVCRLPYELHNASVRKAVDVPGEHLLSPKDLCTIDLLADLVAAGVDSLKIEGRMKSPEYVYAVVSTYRAVLDRLVAAEGVRVTDGERQRLAEAFSRGFTEGFLVGETGNEMMSYGRPNNRGVRVGRVASVRDGLVEVECEVPLVEGDVVEFWTNKGHFAHTVDALDRRSSTRVALVVPKPVGKGDRVFRVRSAEAAFEDDPQEPRVSIEGSLALRIGLPARIRLVTCERRGVRDAEAEAEGAVVEPARTKTVSEDEVRDHVDRFGATPFRLERLLVGLDEGVGIGFSSLHHLRAEAADALQALMLKGWSQRRLPKIHSKEKGQTRARPAASAGVGGSATVPVCAWTTNASCARAARKAGADALYVPALNYKRGEATVVGQRSSTVDQDYPTNVVVALPTVDHDQVEGSRELAHGFDPWAYVPAGSTVFADNLGSVYRAVGERMQVEVGPHVPVTNGLTARFLAEGDVCRIWLSPELSLAQIRRIAEECAVPLGLFVSGSAELMVTEHCVLQSEGPCSQQCETCPRRTSPHFLKDRKGYEMPVITDCCGRSHLYNAVPLDMLHLAPDLIGAGVSAFMVDATLLNTAETTAAVSRAVRAHD